MTVVLFFQNPLTKLPPHHKLIRFHAYHSQIHLQFPIPIPFPSTFFTSSLLVLVVALFSQPNHFAIFHSSHINLHQHNNPPVSPSSPPISPNFPQLLQFPPTTPNSFGMPPGRPPSTAPALNGARQPPGALAFHRLRRPHPAASKTHPNINAQRRSRGRLEEKLPARKTVDAVPQFCRIRVCDAVDGPVPRIREVGAGILRR